MLSEFSKEIEFLKTDSLAYLGYYNHVPQTEKYIDTRGSMWNLPRPGIEPMSSGKLSSTAPPGKSNLDIVLRSRVHIPYGLFLCLTCRHFLITRFGFCLWQEQQKVLCPSWYIASGGPCLFV